MKNELLKDKLLNINWIGSGRPLANREADISISAQKVGYGFTIRNDCFYRMPDNDIGKIEIGIVDERVMVFRFNPAGYVLNSSKSDKNRYIKITGEKAEAIPKDFIGDYDLLFDDTFKMWYIDRDKKKV